MGFIRLIYNFLLFFSLVIVLPVWIFLNKKRGYSIGLRERVVMKKENLPTRAVWIHCASVGEIKTAMPIIEYISSKEPVILTVFSPRAYKFAKSLNIPTTFLPFDFSFLIKKFIKTYKPKILIVEEAEFWFNLITVSSKYIPVISINTNMPKSPFIRLFLDKISSFIVKSEADKEVLKSFVDREKIKVCGNLKLLSKVEDKKLDIDFGEKKVIIAGSTHHPEEQILFEIYKEIKDENMILVVAPRHIERVREIEILAEKMKLSYSLRSQTKNPKTDIYIIDTIGELTSLYKYADVVFVGGTISKVGGHNIFEPILSGKKVIIGDNYNKIRDIVEEAKKLDAVRIVKNKEELKQAIKELLEDGKLNISIKDIQRKIFSCYTEEIDKWT
ncbi:MAG: 3-deoxy-D-manno-octulosonic acid transferase [Hydrogenothermaceae bacterium]|nr:3-deoxy-D-manno-octulosonic acid transferase [Hydrogenothermaceae bacterium]